MPTDTNHGKLCKINMTDNVMTLILCIGTDILLNTQPNQFYHLMTINNNKILSTI